MDLSQLLGQEAADMIASTEQDKLIHQFACIAKNMDKENKAPQKDDEDEPTFYYCWSHGLGRNKDHTSKSCKKPKEGHQRKATIHNMLGGSARIMRKRGDKPADIFKNTQDF